MIDIKKEVVSWHKETFPNATEKAITDKLLEEVSELMAEVLKKQMSPQIDSHSIAEEVASPC